MAKIMIIAEVGSVHDGSLGNAKKLIEAAASCGADAVKFQTHLAEAETLRNAPMPSYFQGEPRYDYFERTGFTKSQWQELKQACDEQGVEFMSSPFSTQAVELLETVGMARYKIPSGEVSNLPLIKAVAQTGKPVFLSSGMSSWEEIDRAVAAITAHNQDLTVLQCTSEYPCPYEEVGLNVMQEMGERYAKPVGLSDHTLTGHASLAAVVLGAVVIEKHFTFSRLMYGSDAVHSLEPQEFKELVRGIRAVETMLGSPVDKGDASRFGEMKRIFEKSLVSLAPIPKGGVLWEGNLGAKKPGSGMPTVRLEEVLGKTAARDIPAGVLLTEDDVDWGY